MSNTCVYFLRMNERRSDGRCWQDVLSNSSVNFVRLSLLSFSSLSLFCLLLFHLLRSSLLRSLFSHLSTFVFIQISVHLSLSLCLSRSRGPCIPPSGKHRNSLNIYRNVLTALHIEPIKVPSALHGDSLGVSHCRKHGLSARATGAMQPRRKMEIC